MPLLTMQHLTCDRARRMRQTQGWSPPSMAALLAMPPSHVPSRSHIAAEKSTSRMTCPPCTKSVVASPASGPPRSFKRLCLWGWQTRTMQGHGVSLQGATTGHRSRGVQCRVPCAVPQRHSTFLTACAYCYAQRNMDVLGVWTSISGERSEGTNMG